MKTQPIPMFSTYETIHPQHKKQIKVYPKKSALWCRVHRAKGGGGIYGSGQKTGRFTPHKGANKTLRNSSQVCT